MMTVTIAVQVLTVDQLLPALKAHFPGTSPVFDIGSPSASAGVYVWSNPAGSVLYIGSASWLPKRLGDYQDWIKGYDPDSRWEVSVVHMLKTHDASVQWVTTHDHDDALRLERRLIEWHRACVGIAPVVVGWDAKNGSARHQGETWARDLWRATHAPSVP